MFNFEELNKQLDEENERYISMDIICQKSGKYKFIILCPKEVPQQDFEAIHKRLSAMLTLLGTF